MSDRHHTLKQGPLKTRNVIRLLELGNFPEEITREARSLASPGEPRAPANWCLAVNVFERSERNRIN